MKWESLFLCYAGGRAVRPHPAKIKIDPKHELGAAFYAGEGGLPAHWKTVHRTVFCPLRVAVLFDPIPQNKNQPQA